MTTLKKLYYRFGMLAGGILVATVFLLLVYQEPFSNRSLVANLGPFPDVFHYILPARCFITDGTWTLCRMGVEGTKPAVGPLYSILLIPIFLIKNDPRMFYYLNVILVTTAIIFLYKIFFKITQNSLITTSLGVLAATSYHLYWFPTLAMAENVILPLFAIGVWICFKPKSKLFLLVLPLISVATFLAKFAFVPISGIFMLYWLYVQVYIQKIVPKIIALVFVLLGMIVALWYGFFHTDLGNNFFSLLPIEQQQNTWFSIVFIPSHLSYYLSTLLGKPTLVLWDTRPFLNVILSITGILGFIVGFKIKKVKQISIVVLGLLLAQILFISSFYSLDSRYIIISIPALLIGISFFYAWLQQIMPGNKYLTLSLIMVIAVSVLLHVTELRTRLAINFKYAETPWFYLATKQIDQAVPKSKDTFVISAIPVYFYDFYATKGYSVLPVAPEQEPNKKSQVYGNQYEYDDLIVLYQNLLSQGKSVYISNYGLGNQAYMHEAYQRVEDAFTLTEIATGCDQACNVYKLTNSESSQ